MKTYIVLIAAMLMYLCGFSQRVGIGTTNPVATLDVNGNLHVADSSVLFSAIDDIPFFPGLPPVEGPGRRMMWYPDKAAFRTGYTNSAGWDRTNIGKYSFASGYSTIASGHTSTAIGIETISSGDATFTSGIGSIASGEGTFASGIGSTASIYASTAMGYGTHASGFYCFASGSFCTASGSSSTAIGGGTQATGEVSTSMGYNTNASGYKSTAMGSFSIASGQTSTAFGEQTTASGINSTVMGSNSISQGNSSIAAGSVAVAAGDYSIAIGESVTANAWISTSLGRHNNPIVATSTSSWVLTEPLLIVGNGTGPSDKKNAFVILKNGNTGIGINNPDASLHVARGTGGFGTAAFHGTTHISHFNFNTAENTYIRAGKDNGIVIINDIPGGKVIIGTGGGDKLTVNGDICTFGNINLTGVFGSCSDLRYKRNLTPISNPLEKILQLHGLNYFWKQEDFPEKRFNDKKQIGFSAQEMETLFPEIVQTDASGYKSVDYSRLTPVLVEAIKEQQMQMNSLQEQNKNLQQQIDELKKIMEDFLTKE